MVRIWPEVRCDWDPSISSNSHHTTSKEASLMNDPLWMSLYTYPLPLRLPAVTPWLVFLQRTIQDLSEGWVTMPNTGWMPQVNLLHSNSLRLSTSRVNLIAQAHTSTCHVQEWASSFFASRQKNTDQIWTVGPWRAEENAYSVWVVPAQRPGFGNFPRGIKCSLAAFDLLNILHGEAQEARIAHEWLEHQPLENTMTIFTVLSKNAIVPRDTPFWREYKEGEKTRFSVVLTTNPLIWDLPDPMRSSMPHLRQCDIGSMYFLRPCKSIQCTDAYWIFTTVKAKTGQNVSCAN